LLSNEFRILHRWFNKQCHEQVETLWQGVCQELSFLVADFTQNSLVNFVVAKKKNHVCLYIVTGIHKKILFNDY